MRYEKAFQIPWKTALVAEIFVIVCLSGCATRTLLVPPGEPVRLRETVRHAKVWVADKDGKEIPAVVDLPEGWYCLPDPGPEPRRAETADGGEK
jgi:hypothetical protein